MAQGAVRMASIIRYEHRVNGEKVSHVRNLPTVRAVARERGFAILNVLMGSLAMVRFVVLR